MKKLSKAQDRTLSLLKEIYPKKAYDASYYYSKLEKETRTEWIKWYKDHIDMIDRGFILWNSLNSRTLEVLAEQGYIEYIKSKRCGNSCIDWVKLL